MDEQEEFVRDLQNWGRQTLLFAKGIQGGGPGRPEGALQAKQESEALVKKFWDESFEELGENVPINEFGCKFASKIFAWTHDTLG